MSTCSSLKSSTPAKTGMTKSALKRSTPAGFQRKASFALAFTRGVQVNFFVFRKFQVKFATLCIRTLSAS
jgi:hypothetical protein